MIYRALSPLLFKLSPDAAHALAFEAMAALEHSGAARVAARAALGRPDPRVEVRVLGHVCPSPLGLAGGFDKDARRPLALASLGFGHLELGTVTAIAQAANPKPNLFRLPADRALVNRLGFPNDGAEAVAARLGRVRSRIDVPVAVSIGKSRVVPVDDLDAVVRDYVASLRAVRGVSDWVVVNVSSPNTAGLRAMQAGDHARALLEALVREAAGTPLLVKVAPDLDDAGLDAILAVVRDVGLAGIVATNTTIRRDGLKTPAATVEAIGAGGLSGPPLRARALDFVRRAREALGPDAVVVGVGGVETAEHVLDLVRAGADLVQMYTGFIYGGPGAPARITRELAAQVARADVPSLRRLRG